MSRRFADRVTRHDLDVRVVLWHGRTGRSVTLEAESVADLERWGRDRRSPASRP